MDKKIGFIGQGWIGKNYADDFEKRGYEVVRYALEEPYIKNRDKIGDCDIVFIAVPTPTTPDGFDDSIIRDAIKLVGKGKIAVIKSTVLPGTTESIQDGNPDIFVLHSPEFLTESTAAYDTANPRRNIIGIPKINEEYKKRAQQVIDVLSKAPYGFVGSAREAELIKYSRNCFGFFKIMFINILYDLAKEFNCNWEIIKEAMLADPATGCEHMDPVHKSGRGCGGHCYIKDFAAFSNLYEKNIGDKKALDILRSMESRNIDLLMKSKKDLDLLKGVYGDEIINKINK